MKYTANRATENQRNGRPKHHRTQGIVQLRSASGSPTDQRIRVMSPRNSGRRRRFWRSARSRSSSSVVRSPIERSSRPIWESFRAKFSTATALRRMPSSTSVAAISAGVRRPSNACSTTASSGRNRKYLWLAGSFRMYPSSPRYTCSTRRSSGRQRGRGFTGKTARAVRRR